MAAWVINSPPLVHLRILQRSMVVVGSAEGLKRVFQTNARNYVKDLDFSFHPFLPILGTGLVTAQGALWQSQRLLMAPTLRVDVLDDVIGVARRAADRLSTKLEEAVAAGRAVEMEEEFRLLTLQVIGEAVLSLPPEECDRVFPQLYLPVMAEANLRAIRPWRQYLPTPSFFAFLWRMSRLNSYIRTLLRTRWHTRHARSHAPKRDILDRLITAIEAKGGTWSAALETQLCYEIKTFLLAGHETSAAMLTWTLYELTQRPDALAKVREEALAATVCGDEPSRAAADQMIYTVSSLKETLRKYSVVPVVTRRVAADDSICGMRVPAGTYLACCIQAVHAAWQQPSAWRPERFLPGGEYDGFKEDIRPFMFVPFIQGPRNCLGQYFALLEARIVLALLVKRFKFEYAASTPATRHPSVIPVGPADGMMMNVS
ncbi:hypothetical protein WJX75_002020 [Coccomyxa subellipsoidea]|uniref:Cytochrome P450 n=1 Tax=Coccomyxa subellipsoidea TaxID=248742 RepID=A0ABR2YQS9_9CHLO